MERHMKPKNDRLEAHHMCNPRIYLEIKMSKVKVTRQINAVTDNAPYAGRGYYNFIKISLL